MFEKNSWFIYHTNFLSSFNTVGPLDLLIFICGPINRHKNNWSLDQLPSAGRTNLPVICEKNSCSLDRLHAVLDDRGGGGVQVEATGQNPIVVVKPWVGVLLLGHRETRQYTPCKKCLSPLTDEVLFASNSSSNINKAFCPKTHRKTYSYFSHFVLLHPVTKQ